MLEKGNGIDETTTTASIPNPGDEALAFLQEHTLEGSFASDKEQLRRLRRKIDYHVIPFRAFAYFANYLDKILLNVRSNASLIEEDLTLIHSTPMLWVLPQTSSLKAMNFPTHHQLSGLRC